MKLSKWFKIKENEMMREDYAFIESFFRKYSSNYEIYSKSPPFFYIKIEINKKIWENNKEFNKVLGELLYYNASISLLKQKPSSICDYDRIH